MGMDGKSGWPALRLRDWQDTCDTLHMYTQIVGKIRLALAPMMNEWWQVPLYVTARGLTTSPIPYKGRVFQLDFDLFDHQLIVLTGEGETRRIGLGASVKDFYREVFSTLRDLRIDVEIWPTPVEVVRPIPFEHDTVHRTYDREQAHRFFEVLTRVDTVLKKFRSGFVGKASPVHFFWGTFDLTASRYSGRPAKPPASDLITRVAYDQEVSSVGFWPGGESPFGPTVDDAAFFSYFAPQPHGLAAAAVRPEAAYFHGGLREHLLMYEDVRSAEDPDAAVLAFGRSVYEAGSRLAGWPELRAPWEKEEEGAGEASAAPTEHEAHPG